MSGAEDEDTDAQVSLDVKLEEVVVSTSEDLIINERMKLLHLLVTRCSKEFKSGESYNILSCFLRDDLGLLFNRYPGMDNGNKPLNPIKEALKDEKRIKYHHDYQQNLSAAIKEDGCNVNPLTSTLTRLLVRSTKPVSCNQMKRTVSP